jgi:hypothetical protein
MFYPILPEILCIAHIKGGILNDYSLIDKASGFCCAFYSFGAMLAIFIGEGLNRSTTLTDFMNDMGLTCDIIAFVCLAFALLFLFTNVGPKTFKSIHKDDDPVF